jgi:steroid 5-alpha reductase family enzyme
MGPGDRVLISSTAYSVVPNILTYLNSWTKGAVQFVSKNGVRTVKNILNAALMLGVIIPPACLTYYLRHHCTGLPEATLDSGASSFDLGCKWLKAAFNPSEELAPMLDTPNAACEIYITHPFLFVNLVYLLVVDIGFYFIYLVQGSTWLIDPHWQLIPQSIAAFWYTHPNSSGAAHPRAVITMVLLNVWAFRLLHNYVRRERWNFGLGEDWRYADMRTQQGLLWIVNQFFAVSVAQHGMLIGLTMPLEATMAANALPLNELDAIAGITCVAGILIGFFSDNQLFAYMNMPNKPLILETGLWKYSRHPNHFGEQMWWVGLLLFGIAAKSAIWPICFGVLFNHPIDTFATLQLIEERMKRRPERLKAFEDYCKRTSILVPLPPRAKTA